MSNSGSGGWTAMLDVRPRAQVPIEVLTAAVDQLQRGDEQQQKTAADLAQWVPSVAAAAGKPEEVRDA